MYSFIGLPFMGSNKEAPFSVSSFSRSSPDSRKKRSLPKTPMNMFPFTKADTFPNIGRTFTRGSSGSKDLKNSLEPSSGRGIFKLDIK